jgi:hypothetical protein
LRDVSNYRLREGSFQKLSPAANDCVLISQQLLQDHRTGNGRNTMSSCSRATRLAFAAGSTLTLFSSAAYAGPGHKETRVPEAVAVPEGNKLKLALSATGVQRYECTGATGTFAWTLVGPDAHLFDRRGRPAGHHSVGPSWQALDGSQVTAKKKSEASGAQGSIPWLLLEASSHTGQGVLDDITFIQRLDTEGGLAPTTACAEANSGEEVAVPYRALYRFYKPTRCD